MGHALRMLIAKVLVSRTQAARLAAVMEAYGTLCKMGNATTLQDEAHCIQVALNTAASAYCLELLLVCFKCNARRVHIDTCTSAGY
jgi:hypothetical protein